MSLEKFFETIEEFAQQNGSQCRWNGATPIFSDSIFFKGNHYFPSGAYCSEDCRQRVGAPLGERERNRAVRHYLMLKLRDEENKFNEFKAYCLDQANLAKQSPITCPSPPRDAVAQLQRGKARIEKLRAQLAELDEREHLTTPIQQTRNEHLAELSEAVSEQLNEIMAVEI